MPVQVDRLAGDDRYATAALISAEFPDGVETVYLANGEDRAEGSDAVVAGAAAGSGTVPPTIAGSSGDPAPMLLVRASGIPRATRAALAELKVSHAVILGGEAVVRPGVEEELLRAGITPIRVVGEDRYDTAALLATTFEPGYETAYVASGEAVIQKAPYPPIMPDALTASARAGAEGAPVLLTKTSRLPRATRLALEAMAPPSITIVGGYGSVALSVELELAQIAPVTRIAGDTRFDTAAKLFESYPPGAPRLYVVSGERFADSLSLSALAAAQSAPVLLANQFRLPSPSREALRHHDPAAVRLVGGPAMLDDGLMDLIRQILDPSP